MSRVAIFGLTLDATKRCNDGFGWGLVIRPGSSLGDSVSTEVFMTTAFPRPFALELRHEIGALRGNWFWFVLLGVLLIFVGFAALSAVEVASLATALFLGALLVVGGISETVGAFWCRRWSGFFILLLGGLFSVIVGILFLARPVPALVALTLLLACLLMVGGIFRIVAALSYHFAAWGWALFSGIVDLILGILIWVHWPSSAFWVFGMFLGISLIFRGSNWISLGIALKAMNNRMPAGAQHEAH
jgi:uncharacterized membrane protein HdeD (DUF308 family)